MEKNDFGEIARDEEAESNIDNRAKDDVRDDERILDPLSYSDDKEEAHQEFGENEVA